MVAREKRTLSIQADGGWFDTTCYNPQTAASQFATRQRWSGRWSVSPLPPREGDSYIIAHRTILTEPPRPGRPTVPKEGAPHIVGYVIPPAGWRP